MTVRILVLSSLYPNVRQPGHGIFIEHRMRHLLRSGQVQLRVLAPIPWFPLKAERFGRYAMYARVPPSDQRHGIPIDYPRYPVIPRIGMDISPLLMAGSLLRPLSRIQRGGYDFDVIDAYYFYPDGVAAAMLGKHLRRPVVITALGSDINMLPDFYVPRRLILWAASKAAAITTVSNALRDRLVHLGVEPNVVSVIRHGVDLSLFQPPRDRRTLREQLGLHRPTLLCVGHLLELKGQHIAIRALTTLPDIELLIAGHGEDESPLKALTRLLGLSNRVRFLGQVDQEQLVSYYGAADALVLPSSREGIPNVVMESLACGTPVIATNVGGIPEVLNRPEAGILLTERTPEALARAVKELLIAYPDRSATRRVAERFTWEETTSKHLSILNGIVDDATGARPLIEDS